MQSIINDIVNRIYGHGRGWAFTPKDFADLGERAAIDIFLKRLQHRKYFYLLHQVVVYVN